MNPPQIVGDNFMLLNLSEVVSGIGITP
jgi:hypothetical protein